MPASKALRLVVGLLLVTGLTGGCSWEEDASPPSEYNYSLEFDGSSSYVSVPGDPGYYGTWTVEVWVKPDSWKPDGMNQILAIEHADTHPESDVHTAQLRIHPAGLLQYRISTHSSQSSHRLTNQAGVRNVDTGWHHIAMTQREAPRGDHVNVLYLDGEEVAVDTGPYPRVRNRFWLGAKASRADFFRGRMDEFRFWNSARDASRIRSAMNQPLSGDESGLVGYWPFNRGGKTMALDALGRHDATIYGAAWREDTPFGSPRDSSQ